jgi:RIO kinase 1
MKDTQIKKPEYVFKTLIDYISKMYKKADLVHADLSAFNILMHKDEPVLIDLGQGVLFDHPRSDIFLKRDISNIVNYFKKYKIKSDEKKIYNKITKKTW